LKNSEKGKKFIEGFTEEYLQYLAEEKLLSYATRTFEPINTRMEALITDPSQRQKLNNKILEILENECKDMRLSITTMRTSNIVQALSRISPDECDKK